MKKRIKQKFILEYWIDDGWFVGKLKGIPGVFSQGKTLRALKENIKDVYKLMIKEEDCAPVKSESSVTQLQVSL
ncbi:MAG: type II toxin-antitoxin system HicB family antitoxin [Elusimicrobiota bacterium]|nr:type II toxin-antitoxin system HicB family antitoxin [Elusimicrobiota bacterium]